MCVHINIHTEKESESESESVRERDTYTHTHKHLIIHFMLYSGCQVLRPPGSERRELHGALEGRRSRMSQRGPQPVHWQRSAVFM